MTMKTTIKEGWLFPLPVPDVVHTREPLLPAPEQATPGRCVCCRADVQYRFLLNESYPLRQLAEALSDTHIRLERAATTLQRLQSKPVPAEQDGQKKHLTALKAAERTLAQVTLAARRLALRHVQKAEIVSTEPLKPEELSLFNEETAAPFSLCAFCHAWHALNGFAAAQGVMVWLPDLHPSVVVALNRGALQAIFSGDKARARQGREVLTALVQNRLAVEEKFHSFRPADFADALRHSPPSQRDALREKMDGLALILMPDSFPEPRMTD